MNWTSLIRAALFLATLASSTAAVAGVQAGFVGPDASSFDILRQAPGGPRIYVQATYPDGSTGVFMVDTGSNISVLSRETAERLGLDIIEDAMTVTGLSGTATIAYASLPSIQLGEMQIPDVEVALSVPGMEDLVPPGIPLDGLLGNNVWNRFILEIDYPADTMVLHRPGSVKYKPKRVGALFSDGNHMFVPVTVHSSGDVEDTVIVRLDTGATELTLCGAAGAGFEEGFTEGLEATYGLGGSDSLPPYRFLRQTRRIPVEGIELGGTQIRHLRDAKWVDYAPDGVPVCPSGMRGLVGHELLKKHRVTIDVHEGVLQLAKSKRKRRMINGHQVLYDQDVAEFGDEAPERRYARARMLLGLAKFDEARDELDQWIASQESGEELVEARILLAQLERLLGNLDRAKEVLDPLTPAELVDQSQIVPTVSGLLFTDHGEQAMELAKEATAARPESSEAWVALADVRLHQGDPVGARQAIAEAARLEHYPDAHLLRRARIAAATGDYHGSMAHVRKLLQLYPMVGHYSWFYATLIQDDQDFDTFRSDLSHAMSRLHPQRRPLDFLVAAHRTLGDEELARQYMDEGLERDCADLPTAHDRDNCTAWYYALGGVKLDDALQLIDTALDETGDRSDFLDTRAMVHLARGDHAKAYQDALAAARMSPGDTYMVWQAERIRAMMSEPSKE